MWNLNLVHAHKVLNLIRKNIKYNFDKCVHIINDVFLNKLMINYLDKP